LQHFAVVAPIGQVYIQLLLDMLHKSQVQIIYSLLPKTVETLLSVPQKMNDAIKIIPVLRDVPRYPAGRRRRTGNDEEPEEDEEVPLKQSVGEILYFGVERGVDGTSAGLLQKPMYLKDLRLINTASPSLLTHPFKSLLPSTEVSSSSSSTDPNSADQEKEQDPYVCAFLDLFADGFSPYSNCSRNYWIVSCLLSLIGNTKEKFHTKCKKFLFDFFP
jgi:hypothetical protein